MRLAFWKKEKPLPMPEDFGKGLDMGMPAGKDNLGMPEMPGAKDDLGLPGANSMPDMPEMPSGMESGPEAPQAFPKLDESRPAGPPAPPPGATVVQQAPAATPTTGKDIEIISLKLDSMKTTLEAINERLARLEKLAESGEESPRF